MKHNYWLKPIMMVLAFFVIIALFTYLPDVFPDVEWAVINPTVIQVMPWIIVFGVGIYVLYQYAMR